MLIKKIKVNKKKIKWYRINIKVNLQNDEKIVISILVDRFFLQDWDIMN